MTNGVVNISRVIARASVHEGCPLFGQVPKTADEYKTLIICFAGTGMFSCIFRSAGNTLIGIARYARKNIRV
jgi:hypothetical protein